MSIRPIRYGAVPAVAGDPSSQARAATAAVSPRQRTLLALAREIYTGRRRRARFLPADLFGEPTWDILLDLYIAARENRPVPTTSACIGAHVPPTTALRWLRILEARGMVARQDDGRDGRRTFVHLSPRGLEAMDRMLESMRSSFDLVLTAARLGEEEADGEDGLSQAAQ